MFFNGCTIPSNGNILEAFWVIVSKILPDKFGFVGVWI